MPKFSLAELSSSDKNQLLGRALSLKIGPNEHRYIQDVFADYLVYTDWSDDSLYRASYEISDDLKVTLGQPEAVVEKTTYEPVAFSAEPITGTKTIDGDAVIYPNCLIFRAGDYKDKKFAMTPEELAVKASTYSGGAQVNLEHGATPFLDGKLGEVRSLFVDTTDPSVLRGAVAIPAWLDALAPPEGFKCSAEWDLTTKDFRGLGLTETPRITGAALMSAYTQFSQKAGNPPGRPADNKEKRTMEFPQELWDKCVAIFTGKSPGESDNTPPANPADDAEKTEMRKRIAALEQQTVAANAAAFADKVISERRALPAERSTIIAAFTSAALDDTAAPRTVTFTVGDKTIEGTRIDVLTAQYAARPQHQLTEEVVPGQVAVLFNKPAASSELDQVAADATKWAEKANGGKK